MNRVDWMKGISFPRSELLTIFLKENIRQGSTRCDTLLTAFTHSMQFLEHLDKSFSWLMTSSFEKFHIVRVPQFGLYFENAFFAVP